MQLSSSETSYVMQGNYNKRLLWCSLFALWRIHPDVCRELQYTQKKQTQGLGIYLVVLIRAWELPFSIAIDFCLRASFQNILDGDIWKALFYYRVVVVHRLNFSSFSFELYLYPSNVLQYSNQCFRLTFVIMLQPLHLIPWNFRHLPAAGYPHN